MRGKRIWTITVGVLVVAVVAFLAIGLLSGNSQLGRVLQGAGVAVGADVPTVFPGEALGSAAFVSHTPTAGGISGVAVTFQGLWGGYCPVWGTDTAHPVGVEYAAGTLRLLIEGESVPGYSADLRHTIRTDETYDANLHAGAEAGLCEAQWIMTHFQRDDPGPDLIALEEGAAIQAAIWHYVEGFQPVWNEEYWCGRQAVYQRTLEIIKAAQGQCLPIPASLDLTADPAELSPGEISTLTALVRDQRGDPFRGQAVNFAATAGSSLGATGGVTDAQGRVYTKIGYDGEGTHTVTASMAGTSQITVVDPTGAPKPRILVLRPISYSGQDAVDVTWKPAPPAVSLRSFEARSQADAGILVRWVTAAESDNQGFNLYRSNNARGPWTRLNVQLIPSQVLPGSQGGAVYEFLDQQGDPARSFYLLEDIDRQGRITQHGPIRPTP
ncbi:MAG TPA: hypothetical protein ENJ31_06940 [Anaerolineae bacterium]|nr:hypothetical protein [Anaerolineae bacterium]